MNLHQVIEQYHAAADDFARGEAQPIKLMYSRRDDVTLANPFGPPARGWKLVSEALDFASSRFRDGTMRKVTPVASYESSDLATILEIEEWNAKVSGREKHETFVLRVTTTFRREDGDWKMVHRHADPITTFHPDGPLRNMGT